MGLGASNMNRAIIGWTAPGPALAPSDSAAAPECTSGCAVVAGTAKPSSQRRPTFSQNASEIISWRGLLGPVVAQIASGTTPRRHDFGKS